VERAEGQRGIRPFWPGAPVHHVSGESSVRRSLRAVAGKDDSPKFHAVNHH
jgi:hypothetical protein